MSHFLDKVKHAIGADEETKSPEWLEFEKHKAMSAHNTEEARADALAQQRELSQHAHPERSGPPDVVPVSSRHELSNMPHRPSLEDAAEGHAVPRATTPDLQGVTHIPESELPPRLDRMENTATRPADPNDPKSMNGLPTGTVAGDDRIQ
ncbi:hypothetical protein JCM11251_000118 [Rhodosporidiobolus azoricus]